MSESSSDGEVGYTFLANPIFEKHAGVAADQIVVKNFNEPLYVNGCDGCVLLMAAEMRNGEIFHGVMHCTHVETLPDDFVDLDEKLREKGAIKSADCFIVSTPKLISWCMYCHDGVWRDLSGIWCVLILII